MTVYVGTSGWQYRDWRSAFYPKKLAQKDWLPYFAERFQVVEVNNTFYRLPKAEVFTNWRERTPKDFVFVLKMSRYLTHIRRLREPQDALDRFFKAADGLGDKIGPVLLQLPPNMNLDLGRLRDTLSSFPKDVRVAVEFRDDSWYVDSVRDLLTEHKTALCLADRGEKLITPHWRTANWGYIRFHWGLGEPDPSYTGRSLRAWARRIAGLWDDSCDVYVFFNNDPHGCAVSDARRLTAELQKAHRETTRIPSEDEVHIGET